ncbi:MAG: SCO family protein [Candidatus Acidiferrales bacterium]
MIFQINASRHDTAAQGQMPKVAAAVALLCLTLGMAGCRPRLKHFQMNGVVVSKSTDTQQITVSHDDIPGFMAAMTMAYTVRDPHGIEEVQPGDRIVADVVVQSSSNYWLEHILITDQSGRGKPLPGSSVTPLAAGAAVPDVPLVNQDGKTIHLSDFKGKAVLLTFIYTRCPNPDFCPRVSGQFAALNKQLAQSPADYARTQLLSISLDPSFDTPPVLRKYGLAYLSGDAAGFTHWEFAVTSPDDLKQLASAFDLVYFQQDNQIVHSMDTILIAPDGTVARTWTDNDWTTPEMLIAVKQAEAPASAQNK